MIFVAYNICLLALAIFFLYKYLTKQNSFNYPLLVFFLFFGFRVARLLKVENWEIIYEFLFLCVSFSSGLILYHYLVVIFNTWLWQTFFIGGLALEEWYRENFPLSLISLIPFTFTAGVCWSMMGGNVFLYISVIFLVAFYFQLKQEFFDSKLVLEFQEKNNVLSCPTGKDLLDVFSFISGRVYGKEIKNCLNSRLSNASFPNIGKRFFTARPEGIRGILDYVTDRIWVPFSALFFFFGIACYQDYLDYLAANLYQRSGK